MRFSLICIFVILGLTVFGQIQESAEVVQVTSSQDTAEHIQKTQKAYNGPLSMFAGNPGKAALYSLMLPGAGQLYNKKYLKVPLVVGIEGAVVGILIRNNRQYKRWDRESNDLLMGIPSPSGLNQAELDSLRERARDQRDITLIATVLVHLFQVADAFIHRHLIEFDIDDDLGFEWHSPESGIGLGLTVTF